MKKLTLLKSLLLSAILLLGSVNVLAESQIVRWQFLGIVAGDNFGASPFAPAESDANLTVGGLTRGWTLPGTGTAAANGWGGNGFFTDENTFADGLTRNQYVTFSLAADAGYELSLSSIGNYNIRRSATGPTTGQWQYSLDGITFENIGGAITWGTNTAAAGNPQTAIDLSAISALQNVASGTTVTFRLVVWGATGGGTMGGTFYFNDATGSDAPGLRIYGTVAVPGALPQVATPTFSLASGVFTETQNVTISTTTENATIHFTTDGSEPTTASPVFSTPISVSTTTTIKAIAVRTGMTDSSMASALYEFPVDVADITALKALPLNTVARITGTITVAVHLEGGQVRNLFVQDESAEGWMILRVPTTIPAPSLHNSGDQLTGVIGRRVQFPTDNTYGTQLEQIPGIALPTAVAGTAVTPVVVAPENLTNYDFNRFVAFKNVEIAADVTFTAAQIDGRIIVSGEETMDIRDHYSLITASFEAGDKVDVTGIVVFTPAGDIRINLLSIVPANGVGINNPNAPTLNVIARDGKIFFEAPAGGLVEVFNVLGQRVVSQRTVAGLNEIPVNFRGVAIVRVGNRTARVQL